MPNGVINLREKRNNSQLRGSPAMIKDMSAAQLNNDMREIFTAESQQVRPVVKKTVNKNLSNDQAIDTNQMN